MFNNPTAAGQERFIRRLGLPPGSVVYTGQNPVALPADGAFTMREYVPGSHRLTNPRTVEFGGQRMLGSYMLQPTGFDADSYRAEAAAAAGPFAHTTRLFMPVRSYGRRVQLRQVRKPPHPPAWRLHRHMAPLRVGPNSRDFSMVDTHFKKDLPINSTSRTLMTAPLRHYRMLFPLAPWEPTRYAPATYRRASMYGPVGAAAASVVGRAGRTMQAMPAAIAGLIRDYTYANPPFQRFEPARAAAVAAGRRLPAALGGLINSYAHQAHVFGHPDAYIGFRGRAVVPRSRNALRASGKEFRRRMRKYRRDARAQRRYRRSGILNVPRLLSGRRLVTFRGRNIRAGGYKYKSRIGSFRSIAARTR